MLPVPDFRIKQKQSNNLNLIGKIKVRLIVVLSLVSLGLILTQLVFANKLATGGQKLAETNQQIQQLQAENTTLRVKIAQESSLNNLAKKAQKLGFVKPSRIVSF